MKNSIEISIPADCLRSAGAVVAHERLAQAATHGLPQKIHAAIQAYLQTIGSEDLVHLADGVRLGDGEIVFTVSCESLEREHAIDLAALRTRIYSKLGMKERPVHATFPSTAAPRHFESTHIENVSIDPRPDVLEEPAPAALTSSIPPNAMLPAEDTSSVPAQSELISGFMPDRDAFPDDSESGTNPARSDGHEELPESTATQVEEACPANKGSPRSVSVFHPSVADHPNQLMEVKDADLAVDGDVTLPGLAASESRESDGDLNGEFHQDCPAPELILENPCVEEVIEVIEMCSDVLVVALRGADASQVIVLDPTVAATIGPGMNLADRLAGAPRKCGGLWELRSFRFGEEVSAD